MSRSVEFWFRRKFNLPPHDPRFLAMTQDDLESEFWAHHFAENPHEKEVVDEEFDLAAELADADAMAEDLPDDFEDVAHDG